MNKLDGIEIESWYKILDALPNPVALNKKMFNEGGAAYDQITYVNKAFVSTLGYTLEDIPTDTAWFYKAYPEEEYRAFVVEEWTRLVVEANKNNSNLLGFPAKITCKDNKERWFQVTTNLDYPIADEYHMIVFVEIQTPEDTILQLQEATKNLHLKNKKLQESEEKLEKQYSLLNTILNTVPVRIFWKDTDGVFLGVNQALLDDSKLGDISQIIGKTDYELPWKKDAQRFREDDIAVTESGVPKLQYEEEQPKEDGSVIYLVTSKLPLRDSNGDVIGILGVYNDVTEYKLLQKESAEKEAAYLEQSRLAQMGEMISMIAHQWRQPLSAMSATAITLGLKIDLDAFDLNTKDGQEEQKSYFKEKLTSIQDRITELSATIDDFRNFFKPNKELVKTNFKTVIDKAMNIIEASLKNNNINIVYNFNSDNEINMHDREVMQVILNILKNAEDKLKEHKVENPKIIISTDANRLSITDNGERISDNMMKKIFDPYFSTKDQKTGTGLGLYMSKIIIEEHHNGRLTVENTDDGVCFTIEINE